MIGYIYKTTNLINQKIYVGQHKSIKFDYRYFGSGKIIKRAIQKYGIENFSCEIIEKCDTLDELNQKEIFWISNLKSNNPDIGYNIADGGNKLSMSRH